MIGLEKGNAHDDHVTGQEAEVFEGLLHVEDVFEGRVVEDHIETTDELSGEIFFQIEIDFLGGTSSFQALTLTT